MLRALIGAISLALAAPSTPALGQKLTVETVNGASWDSGRGTPSQAALMKLQVWLSRAHASPGAIDGNLGTSTRRAIAAYREMMDEPAGDRIDEQLWRSLENRSDEPIVTTHVLSDSDIEGIYVEKLPQDFRELARLEHLSYTSVREKIAERFQMSEVLLRNLNPDTDFARAGTEIVVANVARERLSVRFARLEIKLEQVRAFDKDDRMIAVYPATIGSDERPSPTGEFKVTAIAENPTFHYDPALNLSNVDVQEKLVLPPGPNSPVGVVWISLSAKGYGIHGTPDPESVGKSASHGCIRLTNWDALELAKHVSKETKVTIESSSKSNR
jgi:lipoprotein-anchoring transpeptidase ErfK/SrfK